MFESAPLQAGIIENQVFKPYKIMTQCISSGVSII
jgi:hypothetical protein